MIPKSVTRAITMCGLVALGGHVLTQKASALPGCGSCGATSTVRHDDGCYDVTGSCSGYPFNIDANEWKATSWQEQTCTNNNYNPPLISTKIIRGSCSGPNPLSPVQCCTALVDYSCPTSGCVS